LSSDQNHLLSSSWDKSLRLWSLKTGKCVKRFSHPGQKEILSTTFSPDGRQIFSSGSDNKLSLWNTKGDFIVSSDKNGHYDWVSKIRYSLSAKNKFYASVGWDGQLKLWTEFFKLSVSIKAHDGPIYALAISHNGYYIATGGKDQVVKLWKVGEFDRPIKEFKTDSNIVDLAFHPEMQWVAVATEKSFLLYEIVGENEKAFATEKPIGKKSKLEVKPKFTSIAWSHTGKYLYTGASDSLIRVFQIDVNSESA
jgi:guanine nucleotide-binding protein subunit beta-2-like 1 protein